MLLLRQTRDFIGAKSTLFFPSGNAFAMTKQCRPPPTGTLILKNLTVLLTLSLLQCASSTMSTLSSSRSYSFRAARKARYRVKGYMCGVHDNDDGTTRKNLSLNSIGKNRELHYFHANCGQCTSSKSSWNLVSLKSNGNALKTFGGLVCLSQED